jgi:hypothetical protein
MQRFDYVFSYWLFLWYLLYEVGVVPFNPLPFLALGGIYNLGQLLLGQAANPGLFLFINLFIKILPIYSLRGVPVRMIDIKAGLLYFLVYLGWMYTNRETILKTRTPLTDFIKDKFPSLVNG